MEENTPNHSEKYLFRRNNPKNQNKSIEEHIKHTIHRMKERFDLDADVSEYENLLKSIEKKGKLIYHLNQSISLRDVKYKGKYIWAMVGSSSKRLGKRIKTVLHPFSTLPVPDKLSSIYDHKTFTVAVNKSIDKMIALSEELDLNNKKDFFLRTDISRAAKHGALKIKMGENPRSALLTGIGVRSLFEDHRIEPESEEE